MKAITLLLAIATLVFTGCSSTSTNTTDQVSQASESRGASPGMKAKTSSPQN